MSVREYVGARYVPIVVGEWDNTRTYEPLMVVTNQGNSYTSRQYVPAGIEITNESYWVLSANYNAQVEAYRQDVKSFDGRITANADAITAEQTRAEAAEKANSISVNPNYAILTIKKIGSIPISTGRSAGGMAFNPITNQLVIGIHQNDDTNCALAFVNYDEENESATYIESKAITRKSHMNSLCYYNNKIYCFDWNQNRGSGIFCNGFTGFDLSSNSEFGGNIFMGDYSSFAIFDGSGALFSQGTAKPVLVAKQDHAQNLMMYVGTDIDYFVPALNIPLSSTDFGNSYAQDCHATNTAFYSLYSRSEDNSQTLINVSNYSGNSSINLFIPGATSELEGITKLSGADYFLLVDSLGNIYKTSEIKLLYNSSILSIETINNIFYKYSDLYYNYEDSNVGQTVINFANNGYIVKSFTRPFNRLYYEGKSAVLANVFASSKEMSGFLRFTFTIYKNNNSYNFTLVYSSGETAAAQSYQLTLTNDSFCNVIKSDNSVEHITLENFNTLPLAIKLPFANEALGLTGHRNIPLPYSTLHI